MFDVVSDFTKTEDTGSTSKLICLNKQNSKVKLLFIQFSQKFSTIMN